MRHIQSWVVCCLVWENICAEKAREIVNAFSHHFGDTQRDFHAPAAARGEAQHRMTQMSKSQESETLLSVLLICT